MVSQALGIGRRENRTKWIERDGLKTLGRIALADEGTRGLSLRIA